MTLPLMTLPLMTLPLMPLPNDPIPLDLVNRHLALLTCMFASWCTSCRYIMGVYRLPDPK
jgi:thiol-disulfide isomerase/thioredoxin